MNRLLAIYILLPLALVSVRAFADDTTMIEKQLADIGTIQNEEIVVVQRKYTKDWRHEFTPVQFGGVPFGTVRRTLLGGASYTLHANDSWGWEAINFSYTKTFFSGFTDDINKNFEGPQAKIKPDFQKLLYFLTTGVQWTPMYGKMATFSRWIAYVEPYIGFGVGIAKTEAASYLTFYPAIGIRAFFREWFSMKFEFRDYIYTENFLTRTNPPTAASALRNNYAVTISLSFWLPKMPL